MAESDPGMPAGWGFRPGAPFPREVTESDLPELPVLKLLTKQARNSAIVAMLEEHPRLSQIRAGLLVRKYNLPQVTASVVLQRAKGPTLL